MARKNGFDHATVFKTKREIIQYAREEGGIWDYTDGTGHKLSTYAINQLVTEGVLVETTVIDDKNIAFYRLKD